MPEVLNWQIGRKMSYPYEESRPRRQFAMVMDLNKCIACQTCTVSCKTTWTRGRGQEYIFWNNVETKPYGGYPLAWDVRILERLGPQRWEGGRYAGQTVFEAAPPGETVLGWFPSAPHWMHPNLGEDEPRGRVKRGTYLSGLPHAVWMFYLPRICNHCTYPACLAACPRKAIYKRPEDGVVLVDQSRCRGYRECIRACPYKKTHFNLTTRVAEKCIGCYPALEQNLQNMCVTACIGRIRLAGYLTPPRKDGSPPEIEEGDMQNPIDYLVWKRRLALPLYPQFGLEPNVYYLPPVHVPLPYLRQMFGPKVEEAVDTYRRMMKEPEKERELAGLLCLFGSTYRVIHRFRVSATHAHGYDEEGREIVRVPQREPSYVRPFYDPERGVYRHNVP